MRKCILVSMILCLFVIGAPSAGLSMNSGAHIYVTEQVYGSDDVDLLYGSIAPDLSLYVPVMDLWETGFDDTHYDYISLHPQGWTEPWKRFLIGWETHNEARGADFYSHIAYNGGPGYVEAIADVIAPSIPVDPSLQMLIAHNAVEFAIDFLIQQQGLDADLGEKLLNVALNRSYEDVNKLFNILVAKNKLTDKDTLYQSEMVFRNLIIVYSTALYQSKTYGLLPLAVLGSQLAQALYGVSIDPTDVQYLLQSAVDLCLLNNYQGFINGTIIGIKDYLELD